MILFLSELIGKVCHSCKMILNLLANLTTLKVKCLLSGTERVLSFIQTRSTFIWQCCITFENYEPPTLNQK